MTELKSGHVNNIRVYVMAPRQTSYSGPKILTTQISNCNTTIIYTFNMSIMVTNPKNGNLVIKNKPGIWN